MPEPMERHDEPPACRYCGAAFAGVRIEGAYCCAGCAVAAGVLDAAKLAGRAAGEATSCPVGDGGGGVDPSIYDDPAVVARYAVPLGDGAHRVHLSLAPLRCASCVWVLERLPTLVPGVTDARVRWHPAGVTVTYRAPATLGAVVAALVRLGYPPRPVEEEAEDEARRLRRAELARIGIAGACAGNAMMLAAALYLGDGFGMDAAVRDVLRTFSAAVGWVAIFGPGREFLRGALAALRTRTPHMDLPVALGLLVGAAAGTWNVVRGSGEIFFDTLSVLVFLLLVGRSLQAWQQRRALDAVRVLRHLVPDACLRFEKGRWVQVATAALRPRDRIRVEPEGVVPADGTVVEGSGAVDEAILTGESEAVAVARGSVVYAGTINAGGPLVIEVEKVGDDTRLGRLGTLVERAASSRARLVQVADRIGGAFVVAVVTLAAITMGLWWTTSPEAGVEHAVALLIVACPCALGLATPLAVAAAGAAGAKAGIYVRDADAFEALRRPRTVLLDKTGTLTFARPQVAEYLGDPGVRERAAALERGVPHPVARAIAAAGKGAHDVEAVHAERGARGVYGRVDGRDVAVGAMDFLAARGVRLDGPLAAAWAEHTARGDSAVGVAEDGRLAGLFVLEAGVRPGAAELVRDLSARGAEVAIVSGDAPEVARAVGRRVGVVPARCHGGVTPEGKLAFVRRARRPVVVLGDGVNDAAALSAADAGIAVGGSAEVALRSAAIFLDRNGIAPVRAAVGLADATWRVVRRNVLLSLAYNAVAVALAMSGRIGPLAAAVLMPASSMTVIASTLWTLGRWRP